MADLLHTDRLVVRDWTIADAVAALSVYGQPEVARWLVPELHKIEDESQMSALLAQWIAEQDEMDAGTGRWAMARREDGAVVGGLTLLPMPVPESDVEIGYQLSPEHWGHGYATEACDALVRWAFANTLPEVFALVRPRNERARATAERLGMEWVGESDKYHGLRLQVYRLRPDDLDPIHLDGG